MRMIFRIRPNEVIGIRVRPPMGSLRFIRYTQCCFTVFMWVSKVTTGDRGQMTSPPIQVVSHQQGACPSAAAWREILI